MYKTIKNFLEKLEQKLVHTFYKRSSFYLSRTQNNYQNVKKRIKSSNSLIKVCFLVSDNSKWQYQSLFEELASHPKFDPEILVSPSTIDLKKSNEELRLSLKRNLDFFAERNMKASSVYDEEKNGLIPLKLFSPDIIFYQEPWGLHFSQHPVVTSKYALSFYFPYGFQVIYFSGTYTRKFHSYLYRMFVEHECHLEAYNNVFSKSYTHNCVAIGNPKLDAYLTDIKPKASDFWKDERKFKIIYAPHHSFENDMLGTATFKWSGKVISDFAIKYKEQIEWVLKPHPLFKEALLKNRIMNSEDVDRFFKNWTDIGSVYDKGDYFGLFQTSDLMITDCISFLGEYAPTLNPLIHLVNTEDIFNDFGKRITSAYYKSRNTEDLTQQLIEICIEKKDPKKETRQETMMSLFDLTSKVSKAITQNLLEETAR